MLHFSNSINFVAIPSLGQTNTLCENIATNLQETVTVIKNRIALFVGPQRVDYVEKSFLERENCS